MEQHSVNSDLNDEILTLLSASISERKKEEVNLNDILEYDNYRVPIEEMKKEDFIIDGCRGSVALMIGGLLLPKEIEKLNKENIKFFQKPSQ